MTTRREFMGMLLAATAARTYFLPPIGGWHSDTIVNPSEVAVFPEMKVVTPHIRAYQGRYHTLYEMENGECEIKFAHRPKLQKIWFALPQVAYVSRTPFE